MKKEWQHYFIDYAPTEDTPWHFDGKKFTNVRSFMKWIRKEIPEFEWKSVSFTTYEWRKSVEVKFHIREVAM